MARVARTNIYRKPLRKSLQSAARTLKDSDEFVAHVGAIFARYRRAQAQDSGEARTALRRSLRVLHKHAGALGHWLEQAERLSPTTPEAQALWQLDQSPHARAPIQARAVRDWLAYAERAASDYLQRSGRVVESAAPRVTAEALLATFDHHGLKVALGSARTPGAIVQLLREIAKSAGDELTVEEARKAFSEATKLGKQSRGG